LEYAEVLASAAARRMNIVQSGPSVTIKELALSSELSFFREGYEMQKVPDLDASSLERVPHGMHAFTGRQN
jgi:hypothetical protein